MATSNVRSIESLEAFRGQLVKLSSDWDKTIGEIRSLVVRAESHFSQDLPAYWKRQLAFAQRELSEAKDNLSRKTAAIRPRPTAARNRGCTAGARC